MRSDVGDVFDVERLVIAMSENVCFNKHLRLESDVSLVDETLLTTQCFDILSHSSEAP